MTFKNDPLFIKLAESVSKNKPVLVTIGGFHKTSLESILIDFFEELHGGGSDGLGKLLGEDPTLLVKGPDSTFNLPCDHFSGNFGKKIKTLDYKLFLSEGYEFGSSGPKLSGLASKARQVATELPMVHQSLMDKKATFIHTVLIEPGIATQYLGVSTLSKHLSDIILIIDEKGTLKVEKSRFRN